MQAVFGRVETIEVAGKPVSILLIKNPAGANEVLRTLSLERSNGRPRPLDRAQRPDRRRPRRLLDLGRRLRAARRRRPPGRLRRHPRARDGAAAQVRGLAAGRDRGLGAGRGLARRAPSRRRPTASSPCRPTPPCSSCAPCSPTAGWPGSTGSERAASTVPTSSIWQDVECGGYARRPAALGGARRLEPAARCSSSAPAPGRVALHLAAAGRERDRRRARPRAGRRARAPGRGRRAAASTVIAADIARASTRVRRRPLRPGDRADARPAEARSSGATGAGRGVGPAAGAGRHPRRGPGRRVAPGAR